MRNRPQSARVFFSRRFPSLGPIQYGRGRPLPPPGGIQQLLDDREELLFLHGFGQERSSALFHRAFAMLGAGSRGDDENGNAARGRILAQVRHQFVAIHSRHFDVSHEQVAAHLGDQLRGFHPVGGQLHAVPGLLQNPADEFANADRVVSDDHDSFSAEFVHRRRGNTAGDNSGGARRENAGRAGGGNHNIVFRQVRGGQTVHVNQQDETAIGRNRGAREKFYAAQVLAQVLDHHFVLAQNLLDHNAHLPARRAHNDHGQVAVDGFDGRQTQRAIDSHHFRDDAAHLREQFSANVFDFFRAQSTNLLDHRERHRQHGGARAYE